MIPKIQDVANNKQTENLKNRNIVESQFVHQKKTVEKNSKKVLNTEKTIYNKLKDQGKSNTKENSKKDKDNKDESYSLSEKEKDKRKLNKGSSIDIRI